MSPQQIRIMDTLVRALLRTAARGPSPSSNIVHGYPHGITPAEARVLDALIRTGSAKRAADVCGISIHTARDHCHSAASRMGVDTTIAVAIMWDRWRRSQ